MTPRRLPGPLGRCLLFLLVSGLVIGGLGWVTYASLGVETAQRSAAADADRAGKERLALWRLDGKLLPTLGVENFRKYEDYTALFSPSDLPNSSNFNTGLSANGPASTLRQVSPLSSNETEPWMLLHAQLDPDLGWQSPEVIPDALAQKLRGEPLWLDLAGVTPKRRAMLAEMNRVFPPKEVIPKLAFLEEGSSNRSAAPVTITALLWPDWWNALEGMTGWKSYKRIADQFSSYLSAAPKSAPSASLERNVLIPPAVVSNSAVTNATRGLQTNSAPPQGGGEKGAKPNGNLAANGEQLGAQPRNQKAGTPTGKPGANGEGEKSKRDAAANDVARSGGSRGATQYVPNLPMPAPGAASGGAALGGVVPPQPPGPGGSGSPDAPPSTAGGFGGGRFGGGRGGFGGRAGGVNEKKTEAKQVAGDKAKEDPRYKDKKSRADQKESTKPPAQVPAPKAQRPEPQKESLSKNRANGKDEPNPSKLAGAAKPALKVPSEQDRLFGAGKDRFTAGLAQKTVAAPRRAPPDGVHIRTMRPFWLTDNEGTSHLLFARAVTLTSKTVFQIVVIDWPALRDLLTAEVTDLFPAASLHPIPDGEPAVPERAMAAIPAELDPGPAPELPPVGWTPLRIGLALAWIAALVALGAVWLGGWSLVDLSERRIRFVSAVTHELRTPLTSLRLYLDMLTTGMVKEEAKKQEYLNTLSTESDRLNRLIENVLDFSRLERRSAKVVRERVLVSELLERVKETWAERVAADGKELLVMGTVPPGQLVCADPRMAEQVLGNLIDNARKYTRDAADPRIWVWAKPSGRKRIAFEVEDRGPGVPAAERRSIFRPFRRGTEADTTAGGAGLGLALAKQWADLLGGTLSYRPAEGGVGAGFRLELPVG